MVFTSLASDLVTDDTNETASALFVRDLVSGTTTSIEGGVRAFDISDDGRYVVFDSTASNLVSNDTNGNGRDLFVRDLVSGTTTLVSVNSSGTSGNNSIFDGDWARMSRNGRYVAFTSSSSDLVATDTNNAQDVFVRDLVLGTTRLVSINQGGTDSANFESYPDGISDDGRYISFSMSASNVVAGDTDNNTDVFVRDLVTETTFLMSPEAAGITPLINESLLTVISGDGSTVAFSSMGSGLVANDLNNLSDIYSAQLPDTELGGAPASINFDEGQSGVRRSGTNDDNVMIGTFDRDTLQGQDGNDTLIGLAGVDRLSGETGDDRLTGNNDNDQLSGNAGNDWLNGGQGSDRLLGGAGDDVLQGGDGDEMLIGGIGSDTLTDGAGNDLFIFGAASLNGSANINIITDFNAIDDLIDLRSIFANPAFDGSTPFNRFYQFVQAVQVGADTEIQIDQDGNGVGSVFVAIATLQNVSVDTLISRNFIII